MRRGRPGLLLVLALGLAACGTTAAMTPPAHGSGAHGAADPSGSLAASTTTSTTETFVTIPPAPPGSRPSAPTTAPGRGSHASTTTTTAATSTLLVQFGSGDADSDQFTVTAASWQLNWSYDCASFGPVGNFITTINGYGQALNTPDIGTDQLGSHGTGSNTYDDQGTFNVSIDSECSWSIAVIQH